MRNDNCLLESVSSLRDMAWEASNKYRFDPAVGRAHEKYLQMLNEIIENEIQKIKVS